MSRVETENDAISRGSQSGVSVVRDLRRKQFTKASLSKVATRPDFSPLVPRPGKTLVGTLMSRFSGVMSFTVARKTLF